MKLTQETIEAWIASTTGEFNYLSVMDKDYDKKIIPYLRVMMQRCKEKGMIVPVGKRDGMWRKVDASAEELAWWDSKPLEEDNVILPLDINKYCLIPRPSMIIVAGKYNSGKSCFCINTVALNQV